MPLDSSRNHSRRNLPTNQRPLGSCDICMFWRNKERLGVIRRVFPNARQGELSVRQTESAPGRRLNSWAYPSISRICSSASGVWTPGQSRLVDDKPGGIALAYNVGEQKLCWDMV